MLSDHEHWHRTHVESPEPAQREVEEEGGRNASPRWSSIIRPWEFQPEQRSSSQPETVKRSPERHCESPHIFTTILLSCQMRWGFRNNWKKCLSAGVGIGNSAERGMWAGKRYTSTPIMLKRLMRAAHSSRKRSSSPGLDNLLGNFLMLLIVSAAEWLWGTGENNGEAQRSEISENSANNCTLKCGQTGHRSQRSFRLKLSETS